MSTAAVAAALGTDHHGRVTATIDPKQPEEELLARRHLGDPDEQAPAWSERRWVIGWLVSLIALLAAVLAINITIDPFALAGSGVVPTAVESDRSIKLTLMENLKRGPEILILGSSRSRQAEPSYLRLLTGHTGFNAGVTGGTSADEYVFVRFAASLFPHQKRRYIWFTDVGIAGAGVNSQLANDRRARKFLPGGAQFDLGDVGTYLSTDATKASWRVFRKCVLATCASRINYHTDGSLTNQSLRYLPEHAKSLKASVAKLVASVGRTHQTLAQARKDLAEPGRYYYFERALKFMNQRGEVPVIVLNPVYPTVLAELNKYGYAARRASLEMVAKLHKRYRFVFVDCQDIRKWGGTAYDWSNSTHVNRANMRRMLRYIVAHSHGALR
jgi:hypothetical protein